MVADGHESLGTGNVLDADWRTVRGGVRVTALYVQGRLAGILSRLHITTLFSLDTVAGFVSAEKKKSVFSSLIKIYHV